MHCIDLRLAHIKFIPCCLEYGTGATSRIMNCSTIIKILIFLVIIGFYMR